MSIDQVTQCRFEIGPIRPPSEGGSQSLLIRATRSCSWSRCRFCAGAIYGFERFQLRDVCSIKKDIDSVREIVDEIQGFSRQLGHKGEIDEEVVRSIFQASPLARINDCFSLVLIWLMSGGRTIFLQDADSLVMKHRQLLDVLKHIKTVFPFVERITSYARAKSIVRKTPFELQELQSAGLSRLHVGLESGDDEILRFMRKGVTAAEHIEAGQKAKSAGFELSEYVMIDLGGRERWKQHAIETARVLNAINPDFIRLRPLTIQPSLPLYDDYVQEKFQPSSPHERLLELRMFIENLDITSRICFDHFLNAWYEDKKRRKSLFDQDYKGYKLPEEKIKLLELVDKGLQLKESCHIHFKEMIGMIRF